MSRALRSAPKWTRILAAASCPPSAAAWSSVPRPPVREASARSAVSRSRSSLGNPHPGEHHEREHPGDGAILLVQHVIGPAARAKKRAQVQVPRELRPGQAAGAGITAPVGVGSVVEEPPRNLRAVAAAGEVERVRHLVGVAPGRPRKRRAGVGVAGAPGPTGMAAQRAARPEGADPIEVTETGRAEEVGLDPEGHQLLGGAVGPAGERPGERGVRRFPVRGVEGRAVLHQRLHEGGSVLPRREVERRAPVVEGGLGQAGGGGEEHARGGGVTLLDEPPQGCELDRSLELGPAGKPVAARQGELGLGQRAVGAGGAQLLGLLLQLIEIGAQGKGRGGLGHDDLHALAGGPRAGGMQVAVAEVDVRGGLGPFRGPGGAPSRRPPVYTPALARPSAAAGAVNH